MNKILSLIFIVLLLCGCRQVKVSNGEIYVKFSREFDDTIEMIGLVNYNHYYKIDRSKTYDVTFGEVFK